MAIENTNPKLPHVLDELYELARQHFDDKLLVDLTLAVVAINERNRLAIVFRKVPGSYRPPDCKAAKPA
ncbi:MAG: hypothetical protein ABI443_06845 [Chthoniobacterales bacterium]